MTFPSLVDLSTAGSSIVMVGAEAGDQAGYSVSEAGDVNGDGIDDFIVSAPNASNGTSHAGIAYVIFGKSGALSNVDLGTPLAADDGFAIEGIADFDRTGCTVAGGGDYNGDGFDDLVIGAPYHNRLGPLYDYAGHVYVVFGKASGFATVDLGGGDPGDDFITIGGGFGDNLGISVAFAGDVDGDGLDDLILGASGNDGAYVIFGKSAGSESDIDLFDALDADDGFQISPNDGGAAGNFGSSVSGVGDLNNDGFEDFIVGANQSPAGGTAYVIFGTDQGFANINFTIFDPEDPAYDPTIGFAIRGYSNSNLGGRLQGVSGAGDVNGDGFADLVVGAQNVDDGGTDAGEAYVVFGKSGGYGEVDVNSLSASDGFQITGAAISDNLGASVSSAGDVNGDGFDDVIVGAPKNDGGGGDVGAAYVIFGKATGFATIDLDTALDGSNGFMIVGDAADDRAGASVSSAGDVNCDGFSDILVGAPLGDDGGNFAGEAYLIYGLAPTTAVNLTGTVADQTMAGGAFNDTLSGLGGNDELFGNGGNDTLNGGTGIDSMRGGAGDDTYVLDNAADVVIELSGEGNDLVRTTFTLTLGSFLENLTLDGTANINGTGNSAVNTIIGNSGNNLLDGLTGADTMRGRAGDDFYIVDNIGDKTLELVSEGTDTVYSSVAFTLAVNVENLVLEGPANINGAGNPLDNVLTGNSGNNLLNGLAGADTMSGGLGDDTYIVDNVGDQAIENASVGTDKVQSSVTFALGNNVENLILTGSGTINGTGNGLNNELTGNNAANILDGGVGADTMKGGFGNDTYVVDNVGDKTFETSPSGGTDTVQSSISFTLATDVENLTLTGVGAINAAGNTLANALTGNGANNILNGFAGADTMSGGLGNDTYVVDNVGDQAVEGAAAGTDLVQSAVTFTLGANVENLTLTGSANVNGTGNALVNVINGNAGNNVLDGKAGADTMRGGAGNDNYLVDNAGDVVTESSTAGGTDRVLSTVSLTLGNNVENLTLVGAAAVNGTGNVLANSLVGNAAANTLNGLAGNDQLNGKAGADTLSGGTGLDEFLFDTTLGATNIDSILDFAAVDDTIFLDDAIFTGLATGALATGAFRTGGSAADADDRIIYNSATGALLFDADGAGGSAAVQFATLATGLVLSASDFTVF